VSTIQPRAAATPEPLDAARRDTRGGFARRIECDFTRERPARPTPARGGGMRDPGTGEQLRSARG
jgi:hypothetical protein